MIKKFFALGLLGLTALSSSPSFATPVVHHVTAVINAAVDIPINGGATNGEIYPAISFSGFPFTMGEGDTIEFDVSTINGGLTITDAGPGLGEFLAAINLGTNAGYVPPGGMVLPTSPTVLTYDKSTTLAVTGFTGSLTSSTFSQSVTGFAQAVPQFNVGLTDNLTDSSVTLYDFTLAATFTDIAYQPGYEYLADFDTISGSNAVFVTGDQASVPAPASLPLLGLGLIGIGGLRRKAKAA